MSNAESLFVMEEYSREDSRVIAVATTPELLMGYYGADGPGHLTPVLPWHQTSLLDGPEEHWTTRFRSGNDGRMLTIRRVTFLQ